MKLSTKVDIIDKRGLVTLKMKEITEQMTDLLTQSNDSYDNNIKKKIDKLEAQNDILTWILDEILIGKTED